MSTQIPMQFAGFETETSAAAPPMRGLTLTQPWATLVALGHKSVETRSWSTAWRGLVAIHAAKGFGAGARLFAEQERTIGRIPGRLPFGAIVAICRLVEVNRTEDVAWRLSALERHMGDFSPGRYAWKLTDVRPLTGPVGYKGALSLWDVPANVARAIMEKITTDKPRMDTHLRQGYGVQAKEHEGGKAEEGNRG